MNANLRDRLALAIFLIPLAMWFMALGRLVYLAGALALFVVAATEYVALFRAAAHRPARPLVVGGVILLFLAIEFPQLEQLSVGLSVLSAFLWHLVDFERGTPTGATDFAITVGGVFLLGGLGRYFLLLRALPDGLWWLIATFGAVWMADVGAYAAGRLWGRHLLAPRLSPKKTWEGYAGGIVVSAVSNAVFCGAWQLVLGPQSLINPLTGALLGVCVSALSPLGDVGVSMFKRQLGAKDSSTLLGSHGGVLDRIDSWLIAGIVGYYFATLVQTWFS